jgi:colanic acid/amylovoran biosynthesis glycosyltransferase
LCIIAISGENYYWFMVFDMRIAFIVDEFPQQVGSFISDQICYAAEMGHEVTVVAHRLPKEFVKGQTAYEKFHGTVRYFAIPDSKWLRLLKALFLFFRYFPSSPWHIIQSLNIFMYGEYALSLRLIFWIVPFLNTHYDILHCHYGPNGTIGVFLKRMGFTDKVITTFHGYDILLAREKGKDIYRELVNNGDCFLSISEYNYRNLIQFGADPKKIVNHPIGIDTSLFSFSPPLPSQELIVITVARLHEVKGLDYGIRVFDYLRTTTPSLKMKYHIVGDGPLREELQELVRNLNREESVRFLGAMSQGQVAEQLKRSHIFMLTSNTEALPIVLMEALAVGLPVVSTAVGGIPELIIDGVTGYLVPPGDLHALAKKLHYLAEHQELWPSLGKQGRELIEEKHNLASLNKRLIEIYNNVLHGSI